MAFLDLFRPKWKHSDSYVRLTAAGRLTDKALAQTVYADIIAKSDLYSDVRRAAAEKLTDQGLLADLAKNDPNWDVRWAAAEKLTDEVLALAVFANIARDANDHWMRLRAAEKLPDQGPLADLAQNDSNGGVREAAIKKLTDQRLLAIVAKNAHTDWMRLKAVEKLTDKVIAQAVHSDIARNSDSLWMRLQAAEKLADQGPLADIAKIAQTYSNGRVRQEAIKKLTDQRLLADIAINASADDWMRLNAAEKLTDKALAQAMFADIATNAHGRWMREEAVKMLTNQGLLADIARNDPDWNVRREAAKKLTDQGLLTDLNAIEIAGALARIRELDQTDDSGVDGDGSWSGATPRHMSSYSTAKELADRVNAAVGYEAIKLIPKFKRLAYTVPEVGEYLPETYGPNIIGEATVFGDVVCGFDVARGSPVPTECCSWVTSLRGDG